MLSPFDVSMLAGPMLAGPGLAGPGLAIQWAHLQNWPWLVLALLIVVGAWLAYGKSRRVLREVLHPNQWSRRLAGNRPQAGRWRLVWGSLGLILLGIALLGPTQGFALLPVQRKGIDIVVCLDTSRSMLAQDVGENRLQEAKKELKSLMDVLQGDRMALVAFSGDVRQVAPLTRDMRTLAWFLDSLGPKDNRLGGTDLGGAIDSALELFDGRSGAHEAIVLVTDGEDLEGQGLVAA
ncbi:MAG TPA: VWA domain-containing protein, partial [Planctomycetota bacterium]|nr:VWA domain-containing protein [Planctomycetota bacterium]